MDFLICLNKSSFKSIEIKEALPEVLNYDNAIYLFNNTNHNNQLKITKSNDGVFYIIGDPVYSENIILNNTSQIDSFLRKVDGFYYLIQLSENKLIVSNSMFGILPIFYFIDEKKIFISSSFEKLIDIIKSPLHIDNTYYLEKIIFNYPFLNRTPIKQIKTLSANTYFLYQNNNISQIKHTNISDYFTQKPNSLKSTIEDISDSFIKTTRNFLPKQPYYLTLTGGLDGRTVLSNAIKEKSEFETFSYGDKKSNDILIPSNISNKLGFKYTPIILDEKFIKQDFWENGKSFLIKSYGLGNISRSHYHYITLQHLIKHKFIVSGNFGSEIIRSMKVAGVMTSEILFEIFNSLNKTTLKEKIKAYAASKYYNRNYFDEEIENVINDINVYLTSLPINLTKNQKFYVYMFDNVFAKYFGPEIAVQRELINHRAPFLSFSFIENLLQSEICGANSDFLEKNPLYRYKGQILYSHIMKKCAPELLNFKLDKGYKPIYFIEKTGSFKIAFQYFIKQIKKKFFNNKNNYIDKNLQEAIRQTSTNKTDNDLFNIEELIQSYKNSNNLDSMHFYNIISASIYISYLKKEKNVSVQ